MSLSVLGNSYIAAQRLSHQKSVEIYLFSELLCTDVKNTVRQRSP